MFTRGALLTLFICGLCAVNAAAGLEAYVSWKNIQWDPDTEQGSIEVHWQSEVTLAGFQFNMTEGSTLNAVEPLECDEGWSLYANNDLVLAFSLQANAYIDPSDLEVGLVTVLFEAPYGTPLRFVDPIFASPDAQEIDINANDVRYVGMPECPGDVYPPNAGDEFVDVNDVLSIIGDWGVVGSQYDVNGDLIVDVLDLLEALNFWGPCG